LRNWDHLIFLRGTELRKKVKFKDIKASNRIFSKIPKEKEVLRVNSQSANRQEFRPKGSSIL